MSLPAVKGGPGGEGAPVPAVCGSEAREYRR